MQIVLFSCKIFHAHYSIFEEDLGQVLPVLNFEPGSYLQVF